MILRAIRRIYRIPLILIWTFIIGLWVFPSHLGRKNIHSVRRIAHCTQLWASGLRAIFGISLDVKNPEVGPAHEEGGMIIGNHLSYLDVFVYGSLVNLRFAPKAEIKDWFFVGWVVGLSSPIWVKRENKKNSIKTLEEYRETMQKGLSLIVFPEGTTTDGTALLPFKSTPFEAAIETTAPLYPVLLRYLQDDGEMTACWYGDMTFVPHIWAILGQRRIVAEINWLPMRHPEPEMNRKALALALHDEMSESLEKIRSQKS